MSVISPIYLRYINWGDISTINSDFSADFPHKKLQKIKNENKIYQREDGKKDERKEKRREKMGIRERGSLIVGSLLGERRKRKWEKNEKESAIPLHEKECFKTIYCDF